MKKNLLKFFSTLIVGSTFFLQKPMAQDKMAAAKTFDLIKKNSTAANLSAADIKNSRISDTYVDTRSGATLVYLQQTYYDIDVDKYTITLAFKNDKLISSFGKRIPVMLTGSTATSAITAFNAVTAAAKDLHLHEPQLTVPQITAKQSAARETTFGKMGISGNIIKTNLIWTAGKNIAGIRLCWVVELNPVGTTDYWRIKVDAQTGAIVSKENRTIYCNTEKPKTSFVPGKHQTIAAPVLTNRGVPSANKTPGPLAVNSASYTVIPYPVEAPGFPGGVPTVQVDPWNLSPAGSPATTLKWQSDGITDYDSTRGNNVLAVIHHNSLDDVPFGDNNVIGAHSITALPNLIFNTTPNFSVTPNTDSVFQTFAVTNLFYWNNIMHDISYQYGFNEVSGNYQANNLGRGGAEGDPVLAFAQFGNGENDMLNNANFTSSPDGDSGIMRMFLFDTTKPWRDGDLDNAIICHEYTHGISTRLTGGPSNKANCLDNAEQMGEGWSDYFALMTTTDWMKAKVTDGALPRINGSYVLGEHHTTGKGVRTYPYSTDLKIDPWNYRMMKATDGEVHTTGEIWCSTLWDMTWNIIKTDGINTNFFNAKGTGGNTVAMQLVMMGLKLQPCSPGFIDGRDAILKADTLLYNGRYSCAIWAAFARRGMGVTASQGDANVVGDEVANSSLGGFVITKQVDKILAGQNEKITYTITVTGKSICGAPIPKNITVTDTLLNNVNYVSGGSYNEANRTVTFNGINLNDGESRTFTFIAVTKPGSYFTPDTLLKDTVAFGPVSNLWENTSSYFVKWKMDSASDGLYTHYFYYAKDTTITSDLRLATVKTYIVPGYKTTLSFTHLIFTEAPFNGGVVEISTDNGNNWQDLGPYMSGITYQGIIDSATASPLAGRKVFNGTSYSNLVNTDINLSNFAGKNVKVRFRFCTSGSVGNITLPDTTGWRIRNVSITATPIVANTAQLVSAADSLLTTSNEVETSINETTLPGVVLNAFTATRQISTVLLNWSTVQEVNAASYVVERSADGINFTAIGNIPAAGSGNNAVKEYYTLTDSTPVLNGINYYRIRMVDKSGNITYSVIRSVSFNITNSVIISPNPAKGKLNVTIAGNTQVVQLHLINALGQIVQKNSMAGQYQQLDISRLAAGVYFLNIVTSDGHRYRFASKVIIK